MDNKYLQQQLEQQNYIRGQMQKKDPFDAGIAKAIESARQSMGMNRDQEDKAMRKSLLSFGNAIGQQPKQRGFLANFSSIGKAVAPAIEAHDEVEDESIGQNMKMADYLNQQNEREEGRVAQMEKEAQRRSEYDKMLEARKAEQEEARQYRKDMLEEQKRHHDLIYNKNSGGIGTVDANGLVEGKYVPFASKSERLPFSKKLAGANIATEHVKHATQVMEDLKQQYGGKYSMLPAGIGHFYGRGQELYGSLTGDQSSLDEGLARQKMDQVIGTLAIKFEKELKGGILTGDMVSRFESRGLIPTRWDSPASVAQKLEVMNHEIELEKNIAEQSLLKNAYYKGAVNLPGEEEQVSGAYKPQKVWMVDPKNQLEFEVPLDEVDEWEEEGAVRR
jgi:hypothetical protein